MDIRNVTVGMHVKVTFPGTTLVLYGTVTKVTLKHKKVTVEVVHAHKDKKDKTASITIDAELVWPID